MTAQGDWLTWPTIIEVGATAQEPDGYDVHVAIVQAPGGVRIGLVLRRNEQPIKHLDMTGPLASKLWPLLRDAAQAARRT